MFNCENDLLKFYQFFISSSLPIVIFFCQNKTTYYEANLLSYYQNNVLRIPCKVYVGLGPRGSEG